MLEYVSVISLNALMEGYSNHPLYVCVCVCVCVLPLDLRDYKLLLSIRAINGWNSTIVVIISSGILVQ